MNLRLLTTLVLATTLLLSTLGCSKKQGPVPEPVGTGSYQLDGSLRTCEAKITTSTTKAMGGNQNYDYLNVRLTTLPQPPSGAETFVLYFYKLAGQSSSAYQVFNMELYVKNGVFASTFTNDVTTITPTADGGFSGTFSAKVPPPTAGTAPPAYAAITNGVFTNARP